ncbi:proteasome regulatory particle lid subunit RPN5 [Rhodotorula paludigena]|uniref:proteasome regulatory particle lid subunit RPN5 n=1 Tax=Rhodotorula paludigena TaxID=86838 RepID=UPI00317167D0
MSTAEGVARKQEADLTPQCDEAIPAAEQLAKDGKVQEALDKLLVLEKQARNASDLSSTSRLLIAVISILFTARDYAALSAHLQLLSRKHGQLRQAVQKMVDHAMQFVDQLDGDDKLKLIETLREITEGKIYLEVPRARVTRTLSQLKEQGGDINAASELMQELQVETFGSMERREKVDFILEQMRLLKAQDDWEKMAIVAKRINLKWLAEKEHEDLKLRYFSLMILYGLWTDKYLEVAKHYRAVYETPSIADNADAASAVLRNIVYFLVLAPYDNEQNDLLQRVYKDDRLKEMKESYDLVKCFIDPELRRWPNIQELYGEGLRRTKVFGPAGAQGVQGDVEEDEKHAKGEQRWKVLHDRIVEHNIRVVAGYYTRITLARLSEFLSLPVAETEQFLARLVVSKTVFAKIDRPAGLVSFVKPKTGDEVLNEWSSDVHKLMGLIEKSCHLIAKEHAVHAALKAKQAKA